MPFSAATGACEAATAPPAQKASVTAAAQRRRQGGVRMAGGVYAGRPLQSPAMDPSARGRRWLACLCAAWCRTCDGYRPVLDAVAAEFGLGARWIDIEDEADLLG